MKSPCLVASTLLLSLLMPALAQATNGYFSHGYGIKSQGMAGVGIALPQDGLAAASNPAGIAFVGNRLDLGASLFKPQREASISGNPYGLDGHYSGNSKKYFVLPELGYVHPLDERYTSGLAIYGHGGMNTGYDRNPWANMGASGSAGVSLEQLFVAPTLAVRLHPHHAVGLSLNLAYQRFEARGIQPFAGFSQAPGHFSNRGKDSSTGWGVRVGYTGKIASGLTLGLTYTSKTRMGKFKKYKGLFADQGSFDVPASYGIGLAWQASPGLTLAADLQHIRYGDIKAVGNPMVDAPFGSSGGPGFGWRNQTIAKLGISHQISPRLTLRAGYSHASQVVRSSEVMLNILAPGVIKDHLSLGATWTTDSNNELSLAYTHAFSNTVKGTLPANVGGGQARLKMNQHILGVAYSWLF
ncbi:MAG: long-chain fatty acid transporter [Gammaproteobacteria bacterium]|nr:long-chain fatty acid transporter [Gammaproteobacteria bacterium]